MPPPKKILEVRFRDAVYHDGKLSLTEKDAAMEFHPAGVQVAASKLRRAIVVPYSNILWIAIDG